MRPTKSKQFELELLSCTQELKPAVQRMAGRYPPVVVVGALAVHVATNLHTLIEYGICTRQAARDVLRRMERDALRGGAPPVAKCGP